MQANDIPQSQPACPERERLTAFNEGRLPHEALDTMAEHLTHCAPCNDALARLGDDGDVFLSWLRSAAHDDRFPEDPEYLRMQAAARRLTLPPSTGAPASFGAWGQPPRHLGQYRLVEVIGRGGMGVVYKALHTRLKKQVALKILPAQWADEHAVVARFLRETEAAGSVRHANVVEATDAGEADGFLYLVMEFLDGCDLGRVVHACGALPVADACEVIRQAALGLQRAHECGLVHRDLKPSNLMLTADGVVKILDLGLARLDGPVPCEGASLTDSGQVMGTADYMAPEQASDSHTVDIRADLYSLGCTLYKLLTGQPPFPSPPYDSYAKKLRAHALAPVPPITERRAEVPLGLCPVLDRLLAKEPEERFATPGELAQALEPFVHGAALAAQVVATRTAEARTPGTHPGTAETPRERHTAADSSAGSPTPFTRAQIWHRPWRRGIAVVMALACFGFVAALGLWWVWPPERDPEPFVWHRLLERPPELFVWEHGIAPARLEHFPEKQELHVTAGYLALVKLGTARWAGYRLQVGITQLGWAGYTGVFFGGQKVRIKGEDVVRCQVIELRRAEIPNKPSVYRLVRRSVHIYYKGGGFSVSTGDYASQPLPAPDPGEHCLEVVMGRNGLDSVRWDGMVFPKLVEPRVNMQFSGDANVGAFGVYNWDSHAVYRNAQWMPFQRR